MELNVHSEQTPNETTQQKIQKIVKAWKILNEIPTEGDESKAWDMVHYARHAKRAKELLLLFSTWENAVDCLEFMIDYFRGKGLDFTIETIVKRSDFFREKLARKSR